jgi:hypothetical protein
MMVEPDELADVHLEGVRLVSDNPKRWLVPPEMGLADSVLDWWERLHHAEASVSLIKIQLMRGIIDGTRANGAVSRGHQQTVHTAAQRLYEMGVTIEEMCELTGLTPEQLFGGTEWSAWQQLKAGETVERVTANHPTLEHKVVDRFARMLRGEAVVRYHPASVRAEGLQLVASGMTLREVGVELSARYGVEVKPNTVGSWVSRARRKATL